MSEYDAAEEAVELPKRDEILIELSVLLGEMGGEAYYKSDKFGTVDKTKCILTVDTFNKAKKIIKRAIAYVRSSE